MGTEVSLTIGSFALADPRASSKRLVGCFAELLDTTSQSDSRSTTVTPPITIRRAPGIASFAIIDGITLPVRGLYTFQGVSYAVIGNALYSLASDGTLTQLETGITGFGFVRICDNTSVMAILVPGTSICYIYSPTVSSPFQQLLDPTFTSYGAKDIYYVQGYFVFLALNGSVFYNDDGVAVTGAGLPTFTSAAVFERSNATDKLVGGIVDHLEMMLFGIITTEGFQNVGNATGSPFSSAPSSFMQIGCHPDCGYTVAMQDQAPFWVANDRTVRRRNQQTPQRVSNAGIEEILRDANLTGSYALTPTIGGHPLWVLVMPAQGRTIAYDCLTQQWWEPYSLGNNGSWRPLCYYNAFGKQLVGDSLTAQIGYLDTDTFTEWGKPLFMEFVTQPVYDQDHWIRHSRLELAITPGQSPTYSAAPEITLYVSDDAGQTWRARETQSLGKRGQYRNRVFWTKLGRSRSRVYKFRISDPTPAYAVQIVAYLQGGRWQ